MKRFEVIEVTPRGYCQGVVRAIQITKKAVKTYPNQPIYMLGMIVHNAYVVEACNQLGIICLEDHQKKRYDLLDEIDSGVVIFTAHGVSDDVYAKANEKHLTIVDATCPDVKKTHDIVRDHCQNGDVIYIGKKNHPEAEGVLGISNKVHLVTSIQDVQELPNLEHVLVTSQTTLSILDTTPILEACQKKFPDAILLPEICNATTIRQQAVLNLKDVDVLIVVGDQHSNNSNQLKKLGEQAHISKTYLVDDCSQLNPELFQDVKRVAITSGSSTPTLLTNQVIQCVTEYAKTGNWNPPTISVEHIL